MADPHIVTCTRIELDGTQHYTVFFHEADMVLHTVSAEYENGVLSASEATDAMRPYREFHPAIFNPEFESEDEGGWDWLAARALENEALGPTYQFIDEAVALRLPGVHDQGGSPASGPILTAESTEAFQLLQKYMEGRYAIVALDADAWGEWQVSHHAAYRMIDQLRESIPKG